MGLEGDLKGDYFPLHGNRSYAAKPTGMSLEKEEELRSNGNLFQVSDLKNYKLWSIITFKLNSDLIWYHRNQTPPSSSHLVAVATGQTPVVSSTTKPKTSSSGSMKKIKWELFQWKREIMSNVLSNGSPREQNKFKNVFKNMDLILCTMIIWAGF